MRKHNRNNRHAISNRMRQATKPTSGNNAEVISLDSRRPAQQRPQFAPASSVATPTSNVVTIFRDRRKELDENSYNQLFELNPAAATANFRYPGEEPLRNQCEATSIGYQQVPIPVSFYRTVPGLRQMMQPEAFRLDELPFGRSGSIAMGRGQRTV